MQATQARNALLKQIEDGQVIEAGGRFWRVLPSRRFIVVDIEVASLATSGETLFKSVKDLLIEHVTAHCTESRGLDACRIGWKDDGGVASDFLGIRATTPGAFPVASTVLSAASVVRLDKWNLMFPKNRDRIFIAETIGPPASAAYTLSLTLHCRELAPLPEKAAALLKSCR